MIPKPGIPRSCFRLAVVIGVVHAQHVEHKEHHLGHIGLVSVTSVANIRITKAKDGSPAAGKIKVGDVIVGVGETRLKENTRRQLADPFDRAEFKGIVGLMLEGAKGTFKIRMLLDILPKYRANV